MLIVISLWPVIAFGDQLPQLFGVFPQAEPMSKKGKRFSFWEVGTTRVVYEQYLPTPILTEKELKSVQVATREIGSVPIQGFEFKLSDQARQLIKDYFNKEKMPLVVMIDGFIYSDIDHERGKSISEGGIFFIPFPQQQPSSQHLITLLAEKFRKESLLKK